MRVLAIGDIHGCSRALGALLSAVGPGPGDTLVTLGDYVDRGPDSAAVVERLLRLSRAGPGAGPSGPRLVALRGNHEEMMLRARDDPDELGPWIAAGGEATLASYSVLGDAGKVVDVPEEHWKFLDRYCVDWYETPTHLFVHAGARPGLAMAEQSPLVLHWETFDAAEPHRSGKTLVCGHTPQKNGLPRNVGYAVCIDTHAHAGGWLTCLDVLSGHLWQANERGETRTARIEAFRE